MSNPALLHDMQCDIRRLRAALAPLADLDLSVNDLEYAGNPQIIYQCNKTIITVGDVRRARRAMLDTRAGH